MTVTKQSGGHSIAVYKPGSTTGLTSCKSLLAVGRVHFVAPADYSENSVLEKRIQLLLKSVISSIDFQSELFSCRRENSLLP